jgi:O-antigen ligase
MLRSRMRSVSPDPLSLVIRVLTLGSVAALAALTLVDRGATRMFATPWSWVLIFAVATPLLTLLLRTFPRARPIILPSTPWLVCAAAVAVVSVASALASPYRGASFLSAAIPVGAVAVFLLGQDWLAFDPERNRARLEQFLALGATLVVVASTVLWLIDVSAAFQGGYLSQVLLVLRNPHPLGHSNYTAGLMLLSLPWLVLAVRRNQGATRIVLVFLAALALFNLFNSGSRGGLLGLAVLGVAGVAAARLGWKKFLLIGAGAIVLAAALAAANPRIRTLFKSPDPAAEPGLSNVQRTAMFQAGGLMGRDRPVLGWGPGTTPLAYPRYRHAVEGGAENVLQLHSLPVQLWAETGAVGLLAALGLLVLVSLSWRRAPVAAVTLAGYAVFALTDYQLDVPVFAAAVALLLALLARPATAPATHAVRLGLSFATLACAAAIIGFAGRDPSPRLNVAALTLAREPSFHDRTVALLNESLRLNPDQEIAHFNLGWLLVVSDPAAAEKHFIAAAQLVPDKGGVYFGLGLARMNQGRRDAAAKAFALECVNEPLFLASPWWSIPDIAALREATTADYTVLLDRVQQAKETNPWTQAQAARLATLAPRLGRPSPGPEKNYRRERIGYPVLMRDLDLPVPTDLYDVREDPRFPDSVPFPLPSKGWLPSSRLLNLLDDAR